MDAISEAAEKTGELERCALSEMVIDVQGLGREQVARGHFLLKEGVRVELRRGLQKVHKMFVFLASILCSKQMATLIIFTEDYLLLNHISER